MGQWGREATRQGRAPALKWEDCIQYVPNKCLAINRIKLNNSIHCTSIDPLLHSGWEGGGLGPSAL